MPFSRMHFLYVSLTGIIPAALAAIGPVTSLNIDNAVLAPDGYPRSTVVANGQFPGPLIQGNKGDNFKINVVDELTDNTMERSTTIHWHGLFQHGTNYNDGTGSVTQCPIIPKESYQYDFSVPDQAGTFWYHSHVSTQLCDGLRGPLVVYDPEDPHRSLYDVDDESTVITLADWHHLPSRNVTPPFNSDSTLINGRGRYPNGPPAPLSVVNVHPGKRYRFRLVSTTCDSYFTFSIDGHNLTIIEVDGVNTEPLVVDSIQIFAGQRYSFILDASLAVNNYWVRAIPKNASIGDGGPGGFTGGINSAILHYHGARSGDPKTVNTTSVIPLLETNLHPLENPGAPGKPYAGGADVSLTLQLGRNAANTRFTINNHTFVPPTVPVLLQILSGVMNATELLPKGSVYALPANKSIELSIPSNGTIGSPHPFHLHGHTFDVVRSAGSNVYNYANPVRRDVVSTGLAGDNVTIRFFTDNSGPWFLHCHIDWHLNLGMAVVFAEDIQGIPVDDPVTPDWEALCPKYDTFVADS